MGAVKYLLGVLIVAICVSESLSQIVVQNFTSNAKTCNDCNSTNADCNAKSGYVLCSCKSGFVGDGLNCTKFVFCDSNPCCPQGFYWDNVNKRCVDIDECKSDSTNACLGKSSCANRNGIYLCNGPANPLCPTSVCSADKSCVKTPNSDGSFSLNCIDPCENYQEIDGSKRLFNISSSGRFATDRYLFGWYRYKNGLRMKEGCVGPLKCGSLEPLTLAANGHPTASEGVKSTNLINNALSGCASGPGIQVKLCPGGFYVYRFFGLLKFDVYCTEVSPAPTTTTTTTTVTTPTTEPPSSTTTTTPQPPTTTTTTKPEPPSSTTAAPPHSTTTTTAAPPSSTTTTKPEPPSSTTAAPPHSTTNTTAAPPSSTTTTKPEPPSSTTAAPPHSTTNTTAAPPSSTTTVSHISSHTPSTGITTSISNHTTTPCNNITSASPVISTPHIYPEENITVTTVKSRSILSVRILSRVINNKEVKSLEINETTTVNIEMKTISPSKIHIKNTKSISPTSVLIMVGGTEPESLSNHTDTTITTSETTAANPEPFVPDSYCSKPAETSTITETSAVAGNTCSKVTSASITTTITTTEEVIVLGPNGFSKSCPYV